MMKKAKKLPFLLAACASTVILAIVNSSFGVMLAPITDGYLDGGQSASRGYPNSAMQIGCIVAVLLLAVLGKNIKGGGKTLLLGASALVMMLSLLILGGEPSEFAVFVAVFGIVGLAYGAIDVVSSALVADTYGERASDMMCLLHGSHGAAGIIAPIAVSAVLARTDVWGEKWTLPYTLIAVFVALVFVYLMLLHARTRKNAPSALASASESGKTDAKPQTSVKKLLPLALSICLYGVYLVGMINTRRALKTRSCPSGSRL